MFASLVNKGKTLAVAASLAIVAALSVPVTAMAAGGGSSFSLGSAQTEVLSYVVTTQVFIIAIGLAVLGMIMIAKAVKWARRAG